MSEKFSFKNKTEFIKKLTELVKNGVSAKNINVLSPYHIHEVDEILEPPLSKLKFFTLFGALSGLITGFAFTIGASLDWPLMSGGKPIVSIPAFLIIAFELTILFGAIISFIGFLILSRLPGVTQIINPEESGNEFVILIESEGE